MCNQRERIAVLDRYLAADVCCEGRVGLSIGPVSLRLERAAFEQLASFVTKTQRRLVVRDEHGEHWRGIVKAPDLEQQGL